MTGTYQSNHCKQKFIVTSVANKGVVSYFAENVNTGAVFSIDKAFIEHLVSFNSWKKL